MLKLSDQEFKTTMINMLSALIEKANNMQVKIRSVRREKEILRKTQKEMLEVKSTRPEMKNALDGFISRLDTAKERIWS